MKTDDKEYWLREYGVLIMSKQTGTQAYDGRWNYGSSYAVVRLETRSKVIDALYESAKDKLFYWCEYCEKQL